jgi:hypothetical protein
MSLGAFISLEDISEALPLYREEVISVEMDPPLRDAYKKLEEDIKRALQEHRRNPTVMSVALNLCSFIQIGRSGSGISMDTNTTLRPRNARDSSSLRPGIWTRATSTPRSVASLRK